MLSECEMPQEAKENKTRSRGTRRNELHPSGVHDSDESVSQMCGTLGYWDTGARYLAAIHRDRKAVLTYAGVPAEYSASQRNAIIKF